MVLYQVSEASIQLKSMLKNQGQAAPQSKSDNLPKPEVRRTRRLAAGLCLAAGFLAPRPDLLAVRVFKAASALAVAHYTQ